MSTILLYHAFGHRGYHHVRSSFVASRVTDCVAFVRIFHQH